MHNASLTHNFFAAMAGEPAIKNYLQGNIQKTIISMHLTGTSYNHISYFLNGYLHIAGFRNFPDYSTHEFQFYPIYLHRHNEKQQDALLYPVERQAKSLPYFTREDSNLQLSSSNSY